ncbi:MAG TPA: molybdate ABC transporter substrate-binding protein [Actinomycetes bacterium]|jgi:molybdate transport system substrate-binding protein|nr:molybdate ABC transporter substrate-binding protein [Actinomycetes bacterium]
MHRVRPRRAALLALAVALLLAACGGGDGTASGDGTTEIRVFAAASLTGAFGALQKSFTSSHSGVRVALNFAGSQALATQIRQGAPADVFASADQANMDKVLTLVSQPQVFAGNLLQIVVGKGNPKGVRGLADLARPDLKVVLAAPAVPAGGYARQALAAQHVTVRPVSLEDNVRAVVTKVSLGEADAGIAYVTDVTAGKDRVDGIDIPKAQNVPAAYPVAVVEATRHRSQAQAFVDLVRSPEGQRVMQRYGFSPPPTA